MLMRARNDARFLVQRGEDIGVRPFVARSLFMSASRTPFPKLFCHCCLGDLTNRQRAHLERLVIAPVSEHLLRDVKEQWAKLAGRPGRRTLLQTLYHCTVFEGCYFLTFIAVWREAEGRGVPSRRWPWMKS